MLTVSADQRIASSSLKLGIGACNRIGTEYGVSIGVVATEPPKSRSVEWRGPVACTSPYRPTTTAVGRLWDRCFLAVTEHRRELVVPHRPKFGRQSIHANAHE